MSLMLHAIELRPSQLRASHGAPCQVDGRPMVHPAPFPQAIGAIARHLVTVAVLVQMQVDTLLRY